MVEGTESIPAEVPAALSTPGSGIGSGPEPVTGAGANREGAPSSTWPRGFDFDAKRLNALQGAGMLAGINSRTMTSHQSAKLH